MTTRDLGRMRRGRQIRLLALTCFILALLYTLKQHIATSRSPGNQHTLIQVETSKLRQSLVTSVFLESWQSYRRDCFGSDEYSPISRTCYNLTSGGSIGYTIIDSLDTLWLMGLQSEFDAAERWVSRINFDIDGHYSVFETNIRILGGLLSAYALSQRQTFYDKAVDIGERLYGALVLGTGRKFPQRWVNLHKHEIDKDPVVSTAEIGTLQLELKYLAHITGDKKYWLIAEKIADLIDVSIPESGLATTEMKY